MRHTRREVLQIALTGTGLAAMPAGGMTVPEQIKAFCIDFNWLHDHQEGWPNRFAKPGHWAAASPAEHVAWYQALGANVIQTFAVSCNGYAWYKNGFVPPQPGLRHDFLTETVKLGHRKGMMVMAYFCAGANSKWAQDHPDLSYGMPSTLHIPFTDEYLDYLSRSIQDAVRKTGIDGFMIDWVWNPKPELREKGWIDCEKKLYEQLTGNPFPKQGVPGKEETLRYERAAMARCWTRVREAAKNTNPACIVWLSCSNITDPTVAGSVLLREADWLMNESYRADYLEAGREMMGPRTRLIQCLVGWAEHDARGFLSDPHNRNIDLYGFARPRETSLPLPVTEYLGKPIEAFAGKSRMAANDRNIATLARFYNGLALGASAAAEPPGSASVRAAWYEGPQLFVMTGFIANTTSGTWGLDFIGKGEWSRKQQLADLAEWNKGLGRDYDPDATVKAFKDAGATGVIFYDKWHDGLVPHKTKYTNYMTERDLLGDTLRALRRHNMKIVVYYSVGLDANPEAKFKDWVCRDAAGKPMGRAFPGDWMSFYSPYREYVIDHLVEILKKYGPVHGLWLDLYTQPVPLSRDKYTAEAFREVYGKPVEQATEAEAAEFNIKTLQECLQEIRRAVTAAQPNIELTFNGSGGADATRPKRARLVDDQADWFSIEGHSRDRIDSIATVGQGWNRPYETGILLNTSWYVPMSDEAPRASMSKQEAIVSAASVFIRGGNVYAAMTPGHSGVFSGQEDLGLLRAVGNWLGDNKKWIQGSQPVAEIGIFRGDPSDDLVKVPSVGEIWDRTYPHSDRRRYSRTAGAVPGTETDLTLRGLGYLTQLAGSAFAKQAFDPRAYRLVVLPENAPITGQAAARLREYVRGGGNLLAFGYSSRFDEYANLRKNFALADVFGVNYAGQLPGYKTMTLLPDAGLIRRLRGNPGAVAVKATTAKVLANWKYAGETPAVVENEFGRGRVIYISGEELAFGQTPEVLGELTRRLIGAAAISVEGNRQYSLALNRKGSDLLLYLVNNSTGSRTNLSGQSAADVLPSELTTTKEQVRLTLNTGVLGAITGVSLIPSNDGVRFSRQSGSITMYLDASPSVTTLRLRGDK